MPVGLLQFGLCCFLQELILVLLYQVLSSRRCLSEDHIYMMFNNLYTVFEDFILSSFVHVMNYEVYFVAHLSRRQQKLIHKLISTLIPQISKHLRNLKVSR